MQSLVGALHDRADLLSRSSANVGDRAAWHDLRAGCETGLEDRALEPVPQDVEVALGRVWHEHRELITAPPGGQIARLELFSESFGNRAQHPITEGVVE